MTRCTDGLREAAQELAPALVQLRRRLHEQPEVGVVLPLTQAAVLEALAGLPVEVSSGAALSSVTAVLHGAQPGPSVLLRADMDALPVTEASGVPYASRVDGSMHACGHDLHTASLVGAARLLCARRELLRGDVIFMFQPGEEGWNGARMMIEEGVLGAARSPVIAAYALHVLSAQLPRGMFATRPGAVMGASDAVRVTIRGQGGHGSAPHLARDPIPVACEIVTALQTMTTRQIDVFDPVVVTVGAFHAGTRRNVIPESATFDATVRSFSAMSRQRIREAIVTGCTEIAAAHGLQSEVSYAEEYPITANADGAAEFIGETVRDVLGEDRFQILANPLAASEDFSIVLDEVPGGYVLLGACPADDPTMAPFNHAPTARFDDSVLPDAAGVLAALALRTLLAEQEPPANTESRFR